MKTILLLSVVLACSWVSVAQEEPLPLVPLPQSVAVRGGRFDLSPGSTVLRFVGVDTSEAALLRQELRETLRSIRDEDFAAAGGKRSIELVVAPSAEDLETVFRGIGATRPLGEEGYALMVEKNRVLIAAFSPAGLFYGVQTFAQLVRGAGSRGSIPCVLITDWPDMMYRGVSDDISRGPVPTMAMFKEQIRRLARLKVNLVTYYTEHVVATGKHGEFAPAGGALSIPQWEELAAYARRYHVSLAGQFQSFGHFEKILSHPRYTHLGEGGTLLSPAFDDSYDLLREIYDEMLPAFAAPIFFVGADETFDLGRGASKRVVDSLGVGEVYLRHILRIHEILKGRGVRMSMWGDIALRHPDIIERIPKDVIIGTWTYDPQESYDSYIDPFRKAGLDVLVTPGVLNSGRIMPDFRQSFGNICGFVRDGLRGGALGVLNSVWDDGGSALFARDWYGVAYGADQGWHSSPADTTFDYRFEMALYGPGGRGFARAIRGFLELADLAPTDGLNEKALWQSVVPERGTKIAVNPADWDRVLEIADNVDGNLAALAPAEHLQDIEVYRFTASQYRTMARLRLLMIAAARSYSDACVLQRSAPQEARASALRALDLVAGVRRDVTAVRDWHVSLWFRENRAYALDRLVDAYDEHITALEDVERRLAGAIADMDRGLWLPVPAEVRLWIQASEGWYFREWLVSGPIAGASWRDDLLIAAGGERAAHPGVTQEYPAAGATYRWRRFASENFARVQMGEIYPGTGVVYAFATIECPAGMTSRAFAGSSGPLAVFINGQEVYRRDSPGSFTPDEDEFRLPLADGKNSLMIKTLKPQGEGGFTFRLPDLKVRNSKNRYRVIL